MSKRDIKVHILVGLPGSGKTYFAKQMEKDHSSIMVLHENEVQDTQWRCYKLNTGKRYQPMERQKLLDTINNVMMYGLELVLDGLFLENELILDCLKTISEKRTIKNVTLHIWPDDKENCLRNDFNRRRIGSALSIEALTTANVDPKVIKAAYPCTSVVQHTVYRLPDYAYFFRHYLQLEDETKLCSDSWILGGHHWDYEGKNFPISPEPPLENFNEFDELLTAICPNMPYLHYTKCRKAAVSVEQFDDSDYYSRAEKAHFVCDMSALYDCLWQLGYIGDDRDDLLSENELEALNTLMGKAPQDMTDLERAAWKLYKRTNKEKE